MLQRTSFRSVATLLSDAIVLTDEAGRIVWTNPAFHQLCGHSKSEVLNRKPGSFLQGPDTDPRIARKIGNAIRRRKPVEAELINYHKNGDPYWVSLKIIPVNKDDGTPEGFIGVVREITHLQCALHHVEAELAEVYQTLVHVMEKKARRPRRPRATAASQ